MKWVTAGVTFVNLSVVCGVLLGLVGRGLNAVSAALALAVWRCIRNRRFAWDSRQVVSCRNPLQFRQQNEGYENRLEAKTRRMRFQRL